MKEKQFNPEEQERFKALSVRQPYADLLTIATYRDDDGNYCADKRIEVRSWNTLYRGDLLICSCAKPEVPGHQSGVTCGFVELIDTKPASEFTPEDWEATCIPEEKRHFYKDCFGWIVCNPRRVVEMPMKGQLGMFNYIGPKGEITEYPREIALGEEGWKIIQKKLNR